jgi:transposase
MPIALTITRDDYTAAELREAATRGNDADATRRMLALALVLEGYKRGEAGKLCGMDRQTLRDGVLRYNAEGIAGLGNRIAAGPKPRLTPEQDAAGAELVRKGPDLAVDGVVRWRRVDLARVIKVRFNVTLAERSVGAMLRRLGFRRLSVRPRHPRQDPAAQETHKNTLPIWSALCQRPSDEPASRGDQLPGDARQSRRLAPRWSRIAPDGRLNPVENIWQFLRQNHLGNRL